MIIQTPEKNKDYVAPKFDRWDAFVADFLRDHPEHKVMPNKKNPSAKGRKNAKTKKE